MWRYPRGRRAEGSHWTSEERTRGGRVGGSVGSKSWVEVMFFNPKDDMVLETKTKLDLFLWVVGTGDV